MSAPRFSQEPRTAGRSAYKHVREGASKEGAINRSMTAAFGTVNVFASRTVELDCLLERKVRETNGEKWVLIA